VIGPFGLARFVEDLPWLAYAVITNLDRVHLLAELGVAFLLFMIGLELSVDRLRAMRRAGVGLGGAQVVLTSALIAGIASCFNNALPAAMVLGAGFALSSTAIIMQLLAANGRLDTATGQTCFAVLLLFMLIVTGVTMVATPLVAQGARRLVRMIEALEVSGLRADADLSSSLAGHVIISGYGRVGQMVGSVLAAQELPHLALDIDADLVKRFQHKGASIFFGDARRADMLRKVDIEHAGAFVTAMDSPSASWRKCTATGPRCQSMPVRGMSCMQPT
jgi:Sodium/hydrogen exchanger family/TrkA-N domain